MLKKLIEYYETVVLKYTTFLYFAAFEMKMCFQQKTTDKGKLMKVLLLSKKNI
jgi:hypothetical protein